MPNNPSNTPYRNDSQKMNEIALVIANHAEELKQPGVASIRPGYLLENDWPTKEPAIVVIRAQNAAPLALPAQIEGIPVDAREATPVEQVRHAEPEKFARLAAQRSELRPGAFPELDLAGGTTEAVPGVAGFEVAATKPHIDYTAASVPLEPITGDLTFTCHASPDAGWPTLKQFLSQTAATLTVGLYDWTSEHILESVKSVFVAGQKLKITLDNPSLNPTADQSDPDTVKALADELGDDLNAAWALVRSNKDVPRWIFPTAYHIKVAVRDGKSVWLSSGNWNNSNQPDFDPLNNPQTDDQKTARKSDRDWHVIVDEPKLAANFEAYLNNDFKVANAIAPAAGPAPLAGSPPEMMPAEFLPEAAASTGFQFTAPKTFTKERATITPLLTPDPGVYRSAMLNLLNSATKKLYIQLQYIHPSDKEEDADFTALIDAVVAKMNTGTVDVRIITSQFQSSNGWLERLQTAGVDLSRVKIQNGVHNKGFVIDAGIDHPTNPGTKLGKVALGSQNWSGDGVLRNRDAAVIIDHDGAAQYYENIFVHDWDRIARQSMRP